MTQVKLRRAGLKLLEFYSFFDFGIQKKMILKYFEFIPLKKYN